MPKREVKSELFQWGGEHEPTSITGTYLGLKPGKFGPDTLFDIRVGDAVQTWTCPAILASKLTRVAIGETVEVNHLGSVENKSGQLMHNFSVFVVTPDEPTKGKGK